MPQGITKAEFSRIAGCDAPTVSRLIKRGLPLNQDGTIPKDAGLRWYKANIQVRGKRKPKSKAETPENPGGTANETQDRPELFGQVTYTEANRRKVLAEAELKELELRRARKEVVEVTDAVARIGAMISNARARLLIIPKALAAKVARESDEVACEEIIKHEIDQALFELSEYEPE